MSSASSLELDVRLVQAEVDQDECARDTRVALAGSTLSSTATLERDVVRAATTCERESFDVATALVRLAETVNSLERTRQILARTLDRRRSLHSRARSQCRSPTVGLAPATCPAPTSWCDPVLSSVACENWHQRVCCVLQTTSSPYPPSIQPTVHVNVLKTAVDMDEEETQEGREDDTEQTEEDEDEADCDAGDVPWDGLQVFPTISEKDEWEKEMAAVAAELGWRQVGAEWEGARRAAPHDRVRGSDAAPSDGSAPCHINASGWDGSDGEVPSDDDMPCCVNGSARAGGVGFGDIPCASSVA